MRNIKDEKRLRYRNVLTRQFLEKEYSLNKKSILRLSKEMKIDYGTIVSYLVFYNIPMRSHLEQAKISSKGPGYKYSRILTKDFLFEEYVKKQKSIQEITNSLEFDRGTIVRQLAINNIKIRTIKQQLEINFPPKEFIITEEVKSFIDGLLLGDASIPKRKNGIQSRSLTQACKYREYLEHISKRLNDFEITCSPVLSFWVEDVRCKNRGYFQNMLQTHRYKTFEIFRERWYAQGKKSIPRDLKITRDLLLQCYLGDGNFYRRIVLCLNDFSRDDLLFLKDLIDQDLKINSKIIKTKCGFMLAINKSECNKFLEFIGPCPINCYVYKWKDNESEEAKKRKNLNARLSYHKRENAKKENICSPIP